MSNYLTKYVNKQLFDRLSARHLLLLGLEDLQSLPQAVLDDLVAAALVTRAVRVTLVDTAREEEHNDVSKQQYLNSGVMKSTGSLAPGK